MKNQLDLIISVVALVIGLVFAGFFFTTARKPNPTPQVQSVVTTPVKLTTINIDMSDGLVAGSISSSSSSSSSSQGGGGARGGGGRRGGG